MKNIFLEILGLSIKSSYVIIALLLVRVLIRKAPKIYSYMLMILAFIRLILFKSIPSIFGAFNYIERSGVVSNYENNVVKASVEITDFPNNVGNIENISNANNDIVMKSHIDIWQILSIIWIVGIILIISYSLWSYIKLKKSLNTAVKIEGNIYISENISTPFVLGFFKPRIYFPVGMNLEENKLILEHERVHIRRKDYIVKPACFIILVLHWFNPLVWAVYYYLVRDMEMSCDEKVIENYNGEIKKDYSKTILDFATEKSKYFIVPIAFSESDTKNRIKNILKYKKYPKFVGIFLVIMLVVVGCTTLPSSTTETRDNLNNGYDNEIDYAKYDNLYEEKIDELYKYRTNISIYNLDFVPAASKNLKSIGEWIPKPSNVYLNKIEAMEEDEGNIIELEFILDDLSSYLLPSFNGKYDEYYIGLNSDFGKIAADTLFVTIDDVDLVKVKYSYNEKIEERVFKPENTEIFENNTGEDMFKSYIDSINSVDYGYLIREQLLLEDNRLTDKDFEEHYRFNLFHIFNFEVIDFEGESDSGSGATENIPLYIKKDKLGKDKVTIFNSIAHNSTSVGNGIDYYSYKGTETALLKIVLLGEKNNYEYLKTIRYKVDEITEENFDEFFGEGEYKKNKDKIKTNKELTEENLAIEKDRLKEIKKNK